MKQKYIIGDIVMYDNKIMVVKEPRDGSHFDLSCPKEGLTYCFVSVDNIKPVDLTSAILEKNGWEKYRSNIVFKDRGLGWIAYRHPNYPFTLRYDNILGMCDVSFNDGKNNLLSIESVHQLQHLLFGLGINNNMEV